MPKTSYACKQCSKEFQSYAYRQSQFCSRACYAKNSSHPVPICLRCEKEMKKAGRKYRCSIECTRAALRESQGSSDAQK